MRKGILGGTFNPVHLAHLMLAEYAREAFHLDEIIFMPSRKPAYKNSADILPDETRLELLRLAIEDNSHFTVSDLELKREGNTYTSDTILELKRIQPEHEFYFILGGDSLMSLEHWHEVEILYKNAHFLAAQRPGNDFQKIADKAEELKKRFGADIQVFEAPMVDISSTEIRNRLKQHKSIKYLVPTKAEDMLINLFERV